MGKGAIKRYTRDGYIEINGACRKGKYHRLISKIDESMIEADHAFVVYRNFGFNLEVGKKWHELGFMSFSLSKEIAEQWDVKSPIGILKIRKGDKYVAGSPGEKEIILPRGLFVDVVAQSDDGFIIEIIT